MNTTFLRARQTKYATYLALYALVFFAILVVANVLANRYNKTWDSTANKRYSLSEQTLKIIRDLKQPATITYFGQSTQFDSAKNQLDQYTNISPKVRVEYVDMEKKPQLAMAAGARELGTVVVQVGNRSEQAKGTSEEDIAGAFIKAIKTSTRTICFLTGGGEHQIDDTDRNGFSQFSTLLQRDKYETKSVSLLEKAEVPSDCTVLVIGGPRGNYPQPEVDAIKNYVEAGGRIFAMLDPPLNIGRTQISENAALNTVLTDWGVTMQKDLVLDMNPIGQALGLGPQVPLVTSYGSHAIVRDLRGSASGFPLVRGMDIKNGTKTTVDKLFESSQSSLATSQLDSPSVSVNDPKNRRGPLVLAAAGTYDTGKEKSQGRFVVVGSSSWASNGFIGVLDGNPDLAQNAVNWLASDEDLISIHPKAQDDRRMNLSDGQFRALLVTCQFLLPIIVVFAGVFVWWRRR